MTFEEYWGEDPAPGKITAKHAWNAGQAAERERIKSRVKDAAESLWCIRNEVVEEVEGELKRVPYSLYNSLYIGPPLNTLEEFVNRLLEEE